MSKRKRDSEADVRLHIPSEDTDIFGRTRPKSKRRKITESETLEKVRCKLQSNNSNNKYNEIHKQLHKLQNKQLEKESKRDGLHKHITKNWERRDIKQIDYKLDEKNFQHKITDIVQQQKKADDRHALINNINDAYNEEISTDVINTHDSKPTQRDQTHFDAIFSKPISTINGICVNVENKKSNEVIEENTISAHAPNVKSQPILTKKTNKKKSWRERIKKYQTK